MTTRQEKMSKELRKMAAQFVAEHSNRNSMITVTRLELSPDFRNGTLYVTVFPANEEAKVIEFLSRRKRDLRDFMKTGLKTKIIPRLEIAIDTGEKNRQRIDDLLMENNK